MVKSIALPTGVTLQYVEQGQRLRRADRVPARRHRLVALVRAGARAPAASVHALAITARGHGRLEQAARGLSVTRDMAEDLRAFMDALELPAAVIVGHSMGSMVAQRFAIDHPEPCGGTGPDGLLPDSPRPRRDPGVLGHGSCRHWPTRLRPGSPETSR